MLTTMLFLPLLLTLAAAFPTVSQQQRSSSSETSPYKPDLWRRSKGIVRSPCPALNALANEHILPHSGRNITAEMATAAVQSALNFDGSIVINFGFIQAALNQCTNLTQAATPCTAFDLDMLNIPHAAEHDGSLSRQDYNYGQGNNHGFNKEVWGSVMDLWRQYDRKPKAMINISLAQTARTMRFTVANRTDSPGWFEAVTRQSLGETAFYLSVFSDPVTGNARRDWVHHFFSKERLPHHLGWNATQRPLITAPLLLNIMGELAAAEVLQWE